MDDENVEEVIEKIIVKHKKDDILMHFAGMAILSLGLFIILRGLFN